LQYLIYYKFIDIVSALEYPVYNSIFKAITNKARIFLVALVNPRFNVPQCLHYAIQVARVKSILSLLKQLGIGNSTIHILKRNSVRYDNDE